MKVEAAWRERMTRRRTTCIYCGVRIPGAVQRGDEATKEQRFAARFACEEHRYLVTRDPVYAAYLAAVHRCEPHA